MCVGGGGEGGDRFRSVSDILIYIHLVKIITSLRGVNLAVLGVLDVMKTTATVNSFIVPHENYD